MGRAHLLELLANGTERPRLSPAPPEAPYDHQGAMWYVVTVVTVYAMAILFMIVSHINRRAGKRELDREVSAFLRSAPTVRVEEERQRRRNLKRAMQPFIRLALDRRTVGIQVSSTGGVGGAYGSRDLLTLPSLETLTNLSVELLPMTDRIVSARARRLSGLFGSSEASLVHVDSNLAWHGASADEADIMVVCGLNEKIVQCCLDPSESLARRGRRYLRAVPSETELGESASSQQHRMLALMNSSARSTTGLAPYGGGSSSHQHRQHEEQEEPDDAHHQDAAGNRLRPPPTQQHEAAVSPSRTHVPRFLAL